MHRYAQPVPPASTALLLSLETPPELQVAHLGPGIVCVVSTCTEVTLSADEALHLAKVSHWLPLLKCGVRRMLKNEFPNEYLPHLLEDGTIVDRARKRPE